MLSSDPNLSRGTDDLQTRRWSKPDSNFGPSSHGQRFFISIPPVHDTFNHQRYPVSSAPCFGSSEPKQRPVAKIRLPSHETRFDLADSPHPPVTVTTPRGFAHVQSFLYCEMNQF